MSVDGPLKGWICFTVNEIQVLVEMWRREYNYIRPHSAQRFRPPAPEAVMPPPTEVAVWVSGWCGN